MIHVKPYNEHLRDAWNSFIHVAKNGTFMLHRDYMEYHSDRFVDGSLMFYENDILLALLPASVHGTELRSHGGLTYGGFITSEKMKQKKMLECFEVLKKHMQEYGFFKLIYKVIPHIYQKFPAQEDLYALTFNNAKLVRRDVSSTIDLQNILKMPKGRKAQISRAKRENVIIKTSYDFDAFINLENEVLRKNHNTTAVHTASELRFLKSKFDKNITLTVAEREGALIAAALVYEYQDLVHTQYMASNEIGRECGGLDLLIFELLSKYKENKKYFDFGISTENEGRYLNEGLIAQKESFGARSICYDFYEWDIEHD